MESFFLWLKKLFGAMRSSIISTQEKKSVHTPQDSSGQSLNQNIVVGEVVAIDKHPNADRLRVISVSLGDRVVAPVVCGAFNFSVGDKIVLALPGARIAQNIHSESHESFTLSKAKIRGVESQGMICAAFELGLGPMGDKPEILVLKGMRTGSLFSPEMIK